MKVRQLKPCTFFRSRLRTEYAESFIDLLFNNLLIIFAIIDLYTFIDVYCDTTVVLWLSSKLKRCSSSFLLLVRHLAKIQHFVTQNIFFFLRLNGKQSN